MAVRRIRIIGDEVLRKKCDHVDVINKDIKKILNDMVDTLYNTRNAMAIAAPQIGVSKRLIVIDMDGSAVKLINPIIIKRIGYQEAIEGCLSIPNKFGRVKRPYKVTVLAFNEYGKKVIYTAESDLAKCFCHEIDHLDGILFTDLTTKYV